MKNNPKIVTVGEEFVLTVTVLNFPFYNDKSEKDIVWEMRCQGPLNTNSIEIGTGRSISYKLDNSYVNKSVIFTAYVRDVQQPWRELYCKQNVECFVQAKPQKIFVRKVVPNNDTVAVGDKVEFRVTQYSIDNNKVIDSTKRSVKWQYRVDGKDHMLLSEDQNLVMSDKIIVEVRSEWAGKQVIMMPYLNSFTDTVSASINVKPLDPNNSKRRIIYIHGTKSDNTRWNGFPETRKAMNTIGFNPQGDEKNMITTSDWEAKNCLFFS